jgi:hypothetical protein
MRESDDFLKSRPPFIPFPSRRRRAHDLLLAGIVLASLAPFSSWAQPANTTTILPAPPGAGSPTDYVGQGVNDSGTVVGLDIGSNSAVAWVAGQPVDIQTGAVANAVNNFGLVTLRLSHSE